MPREPSDTSRREDQRGTGWRLGGGAVKDQLVLAERQTRRIVAIVPMQNTKESSR